jgi:hypothetical protein
VDREVPVAHNPELIQVLVDGGAAFALKNSTWFSVQKPQEQDSIKKGPVFERSANHKIREQDQNGNFCNRKT